MAYTNTWDSDDPLGSADADTIDDIIRQLKFDIQERMNGIVVDWTADPIQLKDAISGNVTKTLLIPGIAFLTRQDEDDVQRYGTYIETDNSDTPSLYYGLVLPPNAVITQIDMLSDKNGQTNVALKLHSTMFDGSLTDTVENTITNTTAGVQTSSSGTIAVTIAATSFYFFEFVCTPGTTTRAKLYGVKLTYTAHNITETL
jgi:hypothetical protein